MTSVLQQLRTDTAELHEALEKTAPFSTLMSDDFSQDSYTDLLLTLRAFHGVIHQLSQAYSAHPVTAMLDAGAVCSALDNDLQALTDSSAPAFSEDITPGAEVNDLLASGYVWLGSSMGAKMINRWLSQQTDISLPTTYYQTLSGCSQNWAAYRQYLESLTLTARDRAHICHCAKSLFSGLRSTAENLTNSSQPV